MTRRVKYLAAFLAEVFALYLFSWFMLGWAVKLLPQFPILRRAGIVALLLALVQSAAYMVCWGVSHQLRRGLRYAWRHMRLVQAVRRALLETTGYGIAGVEGDNQVVTLPRIKVTLSDDLAHGEIQIRGHIRYDTRLETLDLSSALGRYIVDEQYTSDDGNWHVYLISDSTVSNQLIFDSIDEFTVYQKRYGNYTLYMDKDNHVPLSSLLLVGATGSGKTYALYSLILQMKLWTIAPTLYFCDPKISSLYVLGAKIAPGRTTGEIEDMIAQLETFYELMKQRKYELREMLNEKLDADYRHWQLAPHVLIFDEFAGFQRVVATLDKATRDKVSMYLRNIVLQGRQLGFFIWLVMQKSGSDDVPTAIRDNLPWKVVLGSASSTTYITAFEESANLPSRKFGPGQGLYTYQGLTRGPKIMSFPTLHFDILDAVTEESQSEPPVL